MDTGFNKHLSDHLRPVLFSTPHALQLTAMTLLRLMEQFALHAGTTPLLQLNTQPDQQTIFNEPDIKQRSTLPHAAIGPQK